MKEEWRNIEGYEKSYQVSNLGRIKSLERRVTCSNGREKSIKERILKPVDNQKGYLHVGLYADGFVKRYKVHRLVAGAFIDNPLCLAEVNHIDENKSNNQVNNLEWMTRKDNFYYGTGRERAAKARKGTCKTPVYQYDRAGNLIQRYEGAVDCESCGYNAKAIRAVISAGRIYQGYYWSHNPLSKNMKPQERQLPGNQGN
ncbi:NUMOD4 domain-containing protein [Lacrimispora sp.]|uniref:NUMOD4 domain-containing protein n=1 Tax=Lacrimispora sp. TaxID=2719234 RepID=UPI00289C1C31|nr:NUMOD4 domain-containing protein [Lacrimispora sp.]